MVNVGADHQHRIVAGDGAHNVGPTFAVQSSGQRLSSAATAVNTTWFIARRTRSPKPSIISASEGGLLSSIAGPAPFDME